MFKSRWKCDDCDTKLWSKYEPEEYEYEKCYPSGEPEEYIETNPMFLPIPEKEKKQDTNNNIF